MDAASVLLRSENFWAMVYSSKKQHHPGQKLQKQGVSRGSSIEDMEGCGHVFPFLWVLINSVKTGAEENFKFRVWDQAHTLLVQPSSSSLLRLLLKDKVKSSGGFLVLCDCTALSIVPLSLQITLLGLCIEIPSSLQRRHWFSQLPLLPSHQSDLGIQMSCGLWPWL